MYQYKVQLDVYGGEATVGSIAVATRDYWIERGLDSLESHVTRDDVSDVPTEHNLYPSFEHDDLIHTNGVEFIGINQIQVVDLSTDEEEFVSFMVCLSASRNTQTVMQIRRRFVSTFFRRMPALIRYSRDRATVYNHH